MKIEAHKYRTVKKYDGVFPWKWKINVASTHQTCPPSFWNQEIKSYSERVKHQHTAAWEYWHDRGWWTHGGNSYSVLLVSSFVTTAVCSMPSRFCPIKTLPLIYTLLKVQVQTRRRQNHLKPTHLPALFWIHLIEEKPLFTLTMTTCTDTCSGSLMGAWKCMARATSR